MTEAKVAIQIEPLNQRFACSVQKDLVLTPTTFALSFEAVELMYYQLLSARIQQRQEVKNKPRILKPT
jgi:hypothetical protein